MARIARSAVVHLLDPTYLGLLRVLIAEIPRFPHLAQLFRPSVLEEGPHVVSSVLDRARAAGVVTIAHPDVAARLFVAPLLMDVRCRGRSRVARRLAAVLGLPLVGAGHGLPQPPADRPG